MSKKIPETPQRGKETKRRAPAKPAPAPKSVDKTAAETGKKVKAVVAPPAPRPRKSSIEKFLDKADKPATAAVSSETPAPASAPRVTPKEILAKLQSGQPVDSTDWTGHAVEVRDGQVFISGRVGCVTRKLVNGEPLRLVAEPTAEAKSASPVAEVPAATATPTPAVTEAPVASITEVPAPILRQRFDNHYGDTLRYVRRSLNRIPKDNRRKKVPESNDHFDLLEIEQVVISVAKELNITIDSKEGTAYDNSGEKPREITREDFAEKVKRLYTDVTIVTETVAQVAEASAKPVTPPPPPNGRNGHNAPIAPAAKPTPAPEQSAPDFIPDTCDVCPTVANNEMDYDIDGIPDACDNSFDVSIDVITAPAIILPEVETPQPAFDKQVAEFKARTEAFRNGQSTETLDDLSKTAGELNEISSDLRGAEFSKFGLVISELGALNAALELLKRETRPRSRAEQHNAPKYYAPGTDSSTTPILGTPAIPKVQVPALEAPTVVLDATDIQAAELARIEDLRGKVGILETRFDSLNKQAQALLKGEPATSDTDIPTVGIFIKDLNKEITDLLNNLLADTTPNRGLIDRLKKLEGEIKGVLLALDQKQQNGKVENDFYTRTGVDSEVAVNPVGARRKGHSNRLYYIGVATAAALFAVAGESMLTKSGDEQKEEEVSGTALPPEEPASQSISAPVQPPPVETLSNQTKTDVSTVLFDCEINEAAQPKCSNEQYPDPQEALKWTGEYDGETGTAPAEITLTTPDGKTFTTTVNVAPKKEETLVGTQFVEAK